MKNKKIGILTLYFCNFNMGGLLQAYALQQTLNKLGYDAEQISFDYKKHYVVGNSLKSKIKNSVFGKMIVTVRRWTRTGKFVVRNERFNQFMKQIPHSRQLFHSDEEFSELYDAIVVGSDQVWGDWLDEKTLNCFLLGNVNDSKKKYSYAASVGTDKMNQQLKDVYINALKTFQHVSVREDSTKSELETILPEVNVTVNIDPTLLLTANEWSQLIRKPYRKDKYIFCYFLGDDLEHRAETAKAARKYNLPIATLQYINNSYVTGYDDDFGDYKDCVSGPVEFLSAIKNAEVVITDSFHATLFATQFHKCFYVLSRVDKGVSHTNVRMKDFLKKFGMEDRFISANELQNTDLLKPVDFSGFDCNISDLRLQAYEYLKSL